MHKKIVIDCEPFPQQRPRLHRSGFAYDPSKKKKEALKILIKEKWDEDPISDGIELRLKFFMKIPKSMSQKAQKALYDQPHIKRPDIDNLEKACLDAMNGVVYTDDCLIYALYSEKFHGEHPRIEIEIFTGCEV